MTVIQPSIPCECGRGMVLVEGDLCVECQREVDLMRRDVVSHAVSRRLGGWEPVTNIRGEQVGWKRKEHRGDLDE